MEKGLVNYIHRASSERNPLTWRIILPPPLPPPPSLQTALQRWGEVTLLWTAGSDRVKGRIHASFVKFCLKCPSKNPKLFAVRGTVGKSDVLSPKVPPLDYQRLFATWFLKVALVADISGFFSPISLWPTQDDVSCNVIDLNYQRKLWISWDVICHI